MSHLDPHALAEILDLSPDDEVDLAGLAAELEAHDLDTDDPATHDQIFAAATAYTHTRR